MNQPSWLPVLQHALTYLATALVLGWWADSRLRPRREAARRTLEHPVSTLILGALLALFFFGLAIVSNTVGKNATTTPWTTLVFVGLGLFSVPLLLEYFVVRHRLTDEGIEYRRLLGQRGTLRWLEVRHVRFAPVAKWFALERHTGKPVRISAMLMGLPEFARLVLSNVPRELIEENTRVVLEETRQGRPPSIGE